MGLGYQDRASALVLHRALIDGSLSFIALADDEAGIFDDFVIGIGQDIVGHQYKSSIKRKPIGIEGLLLGKHKVIADCAASFTKLEAAFPGYRVRLRYVTSHFPSSSDRGKFGVPDKDSDDFFKEKARSPARSLAEWRDDVWAPAIEALITASGLSEPDFERFFSRLEFEFGAPATIDLNQALDARARLEVKDIARTIGELIVDGEGKTRWSRRQLLAALGWNDRTDQRFLHRFPLGEHVQDNETSEGELRRAIASHSSGYLSLLGPPGAGKSTMLERFVHSGPGQIVIRYLAYVPGGLLGQGRGEDENFHADLIGQFLSAGFRSERARDDTAEQRRETFEKLLVQAGERYRQDGKKTIIVVDGLDHVPREQKPRSSFLRALPLPESIPEGVLFILGSQRLDLSDIPRLVRDQAGLKTRRTNIAPLNLAAVEAMVTSNGLAGSVAADDVYSAGLGHPLVTQYLLGKLKTADAAERERLLDGGFEYDGDLEKVYDAAWREALEVDTEAAKVLFTLGFVEDRIEPALLAELLPSTAVDLAHQTAHHLLDHTHHGWQVFHNSFRLFLRQQTIERFGQPDPEFTEAAVYSRLAKLATKAPPASAQHWLGFRYNFLAGDLVAARALATRSYFVGQFTDGRRSYDVNSDIRDAFACLAHAPSPERLFDLMLAKDEVWRRQDAISMASQLVTAQVAAGALDLAEAQLGFNHSAGDEWIVIEALVEKGELDRARRLLAEQEPWDWYDQSHGGEDESPDRWAALASQLFDDIEIERRIRIPDAKSHDDPDSFSGERPSEYAARLRYALVSSRLARDPDISVPEISARFPIDEDEYALLYLDSADAQLGASRKAAALACLREYEASCDTGQLDISWQLEAVMLALEADAAAMATSLFSRIKCPDLCGLEYSSGQITEAVRTLLLYSIAAGQIGVASPDPALPAEMAFRRVQTEAIRLGTTIGRLRAGSEAYAKTAASSLQGAVAFLAGLRASRNDDVLLDSRLRFTDEPLFDALCEIVRLVPDTAPAFAAAYDRAVTEPSCAFGENFTICRKFVQTMLDLDGDTATAASRLEAAHDRVDSSRSPHEAIDRLAELAIAFGRSGLQDRARELLHEMRTMSLGTYLPAKKDGIYELWAALLVAANRADPGRARERSALMLQFVQGVDDSDANDQAARIAKTVLVEASASGEGAAALAFDWAKASHLWHWDALVDAAMRGMVRRRSDLVVPIAICWSWLALPYYEEVYNSVTRTGEFLRELVATAPEASLPEIERIMVPALESNAAPGCRRRLLHIFRDALADRAPLSALMTTTLDRWNTEPAHAEDALPDYFQLQSVADIEKAIIAEKERRAEQPSVHHGNIVNGRLGRKIGRILLELPWSEVETFAAANPDLIRDQPVETALAKAALQAGRADYAENLLLTPKGPNAGWGGWADRNLLKHHMARHLLGCADAHDAACADFIRDLALGGSGTGSALWEAVEIFPLLFASIDWAVLWDRLAESIEGYRDFQKVPSVSIAAENAPTDTDLLARLFVEAAGLRVADPREQAGLGLLELLRAGWPEPFCRACSWLIDRGAADTLFAARLLFEARADAAVAAAFRGRLAELAGHEDAGVMALATILGDLWNAEVEIAEVELPAIYNLDLPPMDSAVGRSLRDKDTLAPVIDDPAVWTEGFERPVANLARYSALEAVNIRRRVAQLVSNWGGAEVYGAKATESLERDVGAVGLRIPYLRPHIGASLRALRAVVGELWRPGYLSAQEVELLLGGLDGAPVLPPLAPRRVRPGDMAWPIVPKDTWGSGPDDWIDAPDMRRETTPTFVIGEFARFSVMDGGTSFSEEMFAARYNMEPEAADLDDALISLPDIFWLAGQTLARSPENRSDALRRLRISRYGDPRMALMFDPVTAAGLGWSQKPEDPFSFHNAKGVLMARTRFWRDGWHQDTYYPMSRRWAEGERVELSEAGIEAIEGQDLPALMTRRWRKVTRRGSAADLASRWSSGEKPD